MDIFDPSYMIPQSILLFIVNLVLVARLAFKVNFLTVIVWPVVIYSIGPCLTFAMLIHPVLSMYVFPQYFFEESALFTLFMVVITALDMQFRIGAGIEKYALGREIKRLGALRLTYLVFYTSGFFGAFFQIILISAYGGIFTGSYVYEASLGDTSAEPPVSWGILAGLYEVFFACTVLIFVSKEKFSIFSRESIFYISVLLLRLAGGTRLLLIKEISILLFLMISQKRISMKAASIVSCFVLLMGTVIGVLRSGGSFVEFGALGGFYYESALNALTLNIADYLSHSGYAYSLYNPIASFGNILYSVIPSFLKNFLIGPGSPLESNLATSFGFNTASPVGAMSLFASCIYLFFNPWVGPIIIPFVILFIVKVRYNFNIKSYIIFSILIESLNMWRDSLELFFKLVVQSIVLFIFLGIDWGRLFAGASLFGRNIALEADGSAAEQQSPAGEKV